MGFLGRYPVGFLGLLTRRRRAAPPPTRERQQRGTDRDLAHGTQIGRELPGEPGLARRAPLWGILQ